MSLEVKFPLTDYTIVIPIIHSFVSLGAYVSGVLYHKLQFWSNLCTFSGYNTSHKGYKCLDSTEKIFISGHVRINESCFPFKLITESSLYGSTYETSKFLLHIISFSLPINSSLNSQAFSSHSSASSLWDFSSLESILYKNHVIDSSSSPMNNHSMVTRSKVGVFKPKYFWILAHLWLNMLQQLQLFQVQNGLLLWEWVMMFF